MKTSFHYTALASLALLAMATAGCGNDFVRQQGQSPSQIVIQALEGASGAEPDKISAVVYADVITNVKKTVNGSQIEVPTVFSDIGQVTMSLMLKDQGSATGPTPINSVTFSRYRVVYRRTDGRNTPGVDVPFPFDGGITFTVSGGTPVKSGFELVRHIAKDEAPLKTLINSPVIISTIGDVTFYGRDQVGNEVQASGSLQIEFGNFGDPD